MGVLGFDVDGAGDAVLVAISRPEQAPYTDELVRELSRAGFRVTIRSGPAAGDRSGSAVEVPLETGVGRIVRSESSFWTRLRYRLLLVAGWATYVIAGEPDSRYARRIRSGFQRDAVLRHCSTALNLLGRSRRFGRLLLAACRTIDRVTPPPMTVMEDLRGVAPVAVVVAGRNFPRPRKKDDPVPDYLVAGRRLGIPTIALTFSWDNLSTKGTFLTRPDRLLAWNTWHAESAMERHRLDPATVRIVGCPHLQTLRLPARDGIPAPEAAASSRLPARLASGGFRLLYLGSSANIAADESPLVLGIAREMERRGLDGRIIVRPHPANYGPFEAFDHPLAEVWPPPDLNDLSSAATATLRSSVDAAVLAVGINTSGFLDAASLGLRVAAFPSHDLDNDGLPSRHLRAMLDLGVAGPVADVPDLVDLVERILDGREHRSADPAAVTAALGGDDPTPSRRALDEVLAVISPAPQAVATAE